jgi:hypothetical protein
MHNLYRCYRKKKKSIQVQVEKIAGAKRGEENWSLVCAALRKRAHTSCLFRTSEASVNRFRVEQFA